MYAREEWIRQFILKFIEVTREEYNFLDPDVEDDKEYAKRLVDLAVLLDEELRTRGL